MVAAIMGSIALDGPRVSAPPRLLFFSVFLLVSIVRICELLQRGVRGFFAEALPSG